MELCEPGLKIVVAVFFYRNPVFLILFVKVDNISLDLVIHPHSTVNDFFLSHYLGGILLNCKHKLVGGIPRRAVVIDKRPDTAVGKLSRIPDAVAVHIHIQPLKQVFLFPRCNIHPGNLVGSQNKQALFHSGIKRRISVSLHRPFYGISHGFGRQIHLPKLHTVIAVNRYIYVPFFGSRHCINPVVKVNITDLLKLPAYNMQPLIPVIEIKVSLSVNTEILNIGIIRIAPYKFHDIRCLFHRAVLRRNIPELYGLGGVRYLAVFIRIIGVFVYYHINVSVRTYCHIGNIGVFIHLEGKLFGAILRYLIFIKIIGTRTRRLVPFLGADENIVSCCRRRVHIRILIHIYLRVLRHINKPLRLFCFPGILFPAAA